MSFLIHQQGGRFEPYPNQIIRHIDGLQNLHHCEATATGDGIDADIACLHTAGIAITGTATVNFYGSVDGTIFSPLQATNIATGEDATSYSGSNDAVFRADVRGLIKLRVSVSAVSGNVTVKSFTVR